MRVKEVIDKEVKERADTHKYIYIYTHTRRKLFIKKLNYKRKLLSGHELPIDDPLRLCKRGKIHLRMHAGKLSLGILEPLAISIGGVISSSVFLKSSTFSASFPLHLAQLNLTLGGPLLQLGHVGLCLLDLLL